MKNLVLYCFTVFVCLAGCRVSEPPATPEETERVKKTGQEASQALIQNLGVQLKAALQAAGPESAMHICQQAAGLTTKAISANFEGVTVKRISLKPRNPANAPDEIDKIVLNILEASDDMPTEYIEWTEDAARYYKPLIIQEVCLKCHGDPSSFSQELKSKLKSLYPGDLATGYGLGELRGVIRVDVTR